MGFIRTILIRHGLVAGVTEGVPPVFFPEEGGIEALFVPGQASVGPAGAVGPAGSPGTTGILYLVEPGAGEEPGLVPGPPGPPGLGGLVGGEVPGGTVDGVNAVFTLSLAPARLRALLLFVNGLLQAGGIDYTLAGATVTFVAGHLPVAGDILYAYY